MQEKRKDLKSSQQSKIITGLVNQLFEREPSFYYLSTIEIAIEIEKIITVSGNITTEEAEILKGLDHRDIQMLLSLHN